MRLLIIDQANTAGDRLVPRLKAAGFMAERFGSAAEVSASQNSSGAKAVLLNQDSEAPPAAESVAVLRGAGLAQPIVVIAARDDWRERVVALHAGADAFLLSPVHSEVVVACLMTVMRRNGEKVDERMIFGDFEIDTRDRCAWLAGKCLALTRNEFRLLRCLLHANGGFMSKQRIIDSLWEGDRKISDNVVEVLITRLRNKLGPARILNTREMGYRLAHPETPDNPLFVPEPCRNC